MTIWCAMGQAFLLMIVSSVLALVVITAIKSLTCHPVITTVILVVVMFILLTITMYFRGSTT